MSFVELIGSQVQGRRVMSPESYTFACVPIEDSDQPAHPPSLIRVFDRPSTGRQGSNISLGVILRPSDQTVRMCRLF